ncbi:MAG: hypothetical protein IT437_09240 [Phycisphaerales bacterium]|nr:hypothetical protein [Phycisphaerales bacterium]
MSDAGNRAIDHIANTLAHQASLSREDVDYLVRSAQQGTEVKVQRWALACMADHLHTDTALPPAVRTRMEQAVFAALASTNDRIAICAIACTEQAGLTSRPEFVSKIEELRRDGTPRVAERAARSPIHTGGGEG